MVISKSRRAKIKLDKHKYQVLRKFQMSSHIAALLLMSLS